MRHHHEAHALKPSDVGETHMVIKTLPSGVRVAIMTPSHAPGQKPRLKWMRARRERIVRSEMANASEHRQGEPKIDPSAYAPGSRARALLRGMKLAEADLSEGGGTYDLGQVQMLLNGVSRQALEKRVKEGSLLAVPGPSNRRRYPTFQFTRDGIVPGLKRVQEALPTRNAWAVLNFFVRPDDRLGGRKPMEVLRQGEVDLVVSAARGMGLQGG